MLDKNQHNDVLEPTGKRPNKNLSPLLKQLMVNAEKNVQRLPKQKRHDVLMKKFATSLLIFAGPLSYEFVHQNMSEAHSVS